MSDTTKRALLLGAVLVGIVIVVLALYTRINA